MNKVFNLTDNQEDIVVTIWTLPALAGFIRTYIKSNLIFGVKMIELFILNFVFKLINKMLIY
jgi:hypothetical protein